MVLIPNLLRLLFQVRFVFELIEVVPVQKVIVSIDHDPVIVPEGQVALQLPFKHKVGVETIPVNEVTFILPLISNSTVGKYVFRPILFNTGCMKNRLLSIETFRLLYNG